MLFIVLAILTSAGFVLVATLFDNLPLTFAGIGYGLAALFAAGMQGWAE